MRRLLFGVFGAVVLIAVGFVFLAWRPAVDPVAPPGKASFEPALVRKGAELAAMGYCSSCHTPANGRSFAGGRPMATPFGTIYGTNITPDPETGIGRWSQAAFNRAMRDGLDREGRHLYPAFPYDHFTQLTDDDLRALYAYLMTRDPVRATTPANDLAFPYNLRPLLAGWKLLFLSKGPLPPDASKGEPWNRGRYLAEALSHCSACHSPRNRLGAEDTGKRYDGGEAEGWWAPPLNQTSPAPVPWTEASLFDYLRSWDAQHGGAVGPMDPVSGNLGQAPEQDVRAMATYIASVFGPPSAERQKRTEAIIARKDVRPGDPAVAQGAAIYAGACAGCHESGGQVPFTVRSLAQHTVLVAPDPRNVLHVILKGIQPPERKVGGIMPAFGDTLTEPQLVALLTYLRARFSDQPPWPNVEAEIRRIGQQKDGS
jgi:mono/diheme cytochrome c family protein